MSKSKWRIFRRGKNYTLCDLGRPAIFLIPARRLDLELMGVAVRDHLHRFLVQHFGAYTTSLRPKFGFWKDGVEAVIHDECVEYEVSFLGKGRIPRLLEELGKIARAINEECLYVKAGQYAATVYPVSEKQKRRSHDSKGR